MQSVQSVMMVGDNSTSLWRTNGRHEVTDVGSDRVVRPVGDGEEEASLRWYGAGWTVRCGGEESRRG